MQEKAVSFKKSNVDDLREKLQSLIQTQELVSSYKEEAQDFICKKYSWDDVVQKTVALYRRV